MAELQETLKATGMCTHGNFPSSCKACRAESEPVAEKAQEILDAVGLSWESLEGKRTLEIGAGLAELAVEAKRRGIEVVALEKNPEMWEEEGEIPKDIEYIVGDAEQIPLNDNSVEMVLSKAAPPTISQTKEEVMKVVNEVMRVLKPGGTFRFGPARMVYLGEDSIFTQEEQDTFTPEQKAGRVLEKSLEILQELYPSVEKIDTPNGIGAFELRKPLPEN